MTIQLSDSTYCRLDHQPLLEKRALAPRETGPEKAAEIERSLYLFLLNVRKSLTLV